MARKKTGNEQQTTLRLPSAMMTTIKELAEKENRSLNAQIVTLLQEALVERAIQEALPPPTLH